MPPFDVLNDEQGIKALAEIGKRPALPLPEIMDVPAYYYFLKKLQGSNVPTPPRMDQDEFAWWVMSLAKHESAFNPMAINDAYNARGLFQFIPGRLDQLQVIWSWDLEAQFETLARHVADMLRAIREHDPDLWKNGDPWHILQMLTYLHHAGEKNVYIRHSIGPNTRKFSNDVMSDVPGDVSGLEYPPWWNVYRPYFKVATGGLITGLIIGGLLLWVLRK